MGTKKVAITLPDELFRIVEKARNIEHRSRSEVIQEAIRSYFGQPVYVPTDQERQMLDRALAEVDDNPEIGQSWEGLRDQIWTTD